MKKKLICILLVLLIAGCSQVTMTAAYRQQTEMASIQVSEMNRRCQQGDQQACQQGLDKADKILKLIVDAIYGRAPNEPN